jgi:hypothetical protein
VGRPRIGNDDRHNPSKTELIESPLVAFEIRRRIGIEHAVLFEKTIDLVEDLETKHMHQLGLAQMPEFELFEPNRLQHTAFHLAGGAEAGCQFVGNADGDLNKFANTLSAQYGSISHMIKDVIMREIRSEVFTPALPGKALGEIPGDVRPHFPARDCRRAARAMRRRSPVVVVKAALGIGRPETGPEL